MQSLEFLGGGVWLYPRDRSEQRLEPNVGVILTPEETILVDAGASIAHAQAIQSALAVKQFPPVKTIIYTHHHWDHVFGCAAWNAQNIIAHAECAQQLRTLAARQASHGEQENRWPETRIILPTIAMTTSLSLYRDSARIEIVHVGGRHAHDSLVVRVPDAGVMFLSDSYYPLPPNERPPGDEDLDLLMLESFLLPGYEHFVDGHGDPRSATQMRAMIDEERRRQQGE